MNRPLLLIASLALNVALLAVIGWMLGGEPSEVIPSAEAGRENNYPRGLAATAAPATIEFTGEAQPTRIDPSPAIESSAAVITRAEPKRSSVDRVAQSAVQRSLAANAPSVSRQAFPRQIIPRQAPIRFEAQPGVTIVANSTGSVPAVENVRGAQVDRREAPAAKSTADEKAIHSTIPVETAIISAPSNSSPREWPTGPYTPEEQAYRQQYGWAAFASALRERDLAQPEE